jgi:GDPmannose 4,6-dehydratase
VLFRSELKKEFYRDVDIECLIGDSSKAKRQLGWEPEITFKNLVKKMVKSSKERLC